MNDQLTFYSSFIHGYLKLVLKFGQCSDLFVTESLFVDSLNVSLPWILTCWHPFTKWARVFIIYAMRYQMDSHLAQHLPPFATAHTDVPIIHFHDNAAIDELIWKPRRSMNTCKYEDIEPNRKTSKIQHNVFNLQETYGRLTYTPFTVTLWHVPNNRFVT